ncbi:hypothetical protein ACFLVS_06485, partial [Chloroflexota bacterium]
MKTADQPEDKELTFLGRTQIARVIFAAAESMGIADRKLIENITSQVIERLEQPQPLPGMEHLLPKNRHQKTAPSNFDIEA